MRWPRACPQWRGRGRRHQERVDDCPRQRLASRSQRRTQSMLAAALRGSSSHRAPVRQRWEHAHLLRGEPAGERSLVVLQQDRHKPFDRPEDRSGEASPASPCRPAKSTCTIVRSVRASRSRAGSCRTAMNGPDGPCAARTRSFSARIEGPLCSAWELGHEFGASRCCGEDELGLVPQAWGRRFPRVVPAVSAERATEEGRETERSVEQSGERAGQEPRDLVFSICSSSQKTCPSSCVNWRTPEETIQCAPGPRRGGREAEFGDPGWGGRGTKEPGARTDLDAARAVPHGLQRLLAPPVPEHEHVGPRSSPSARSLPRSGAARAVGSSPRRTRFRGDPPSDRVLHGVNERTKPAGCQETIPGASSWKWNSRSFCPICL